MRAKVWDSKENGLKLRCDSITAYTKLDILLFIELVTVTNYSNSGENKAENRQYT